MMRGIAEGMAYRWTFSVASGMTTAGFLLVAGLLLVMQPDRHRR